MTATERAMCTEAEDRIRELEAKSLELRLALGGLLAWIDGWRDLIDDELEQRWKVGFTTTTPELVRGYVAFARASDENCNDGETR